MADSKTTEDIQDELGKYAKHPRRTAGAAFLIGVGAGMMASKMRKENKSQLQKFMDQLGV